MGQERAGQSSCRQNVSTGHLAATLETSLPFGAAARSAPGPCLLITTNWVNAEMISLSLPLHSLPQQRQLRDTERSKRDFSKWRRARKTWCEYQAATAPGKGRRPVSRRRWERRGGVGWGLRFGSSSHFPSLASSLLSGAAEMSCFRWEVMQSVFWLAPSGWFNRLCA